MQVYTTVFVTERVKATGKQVIEARWVDINKRDGESPKYR